MYSTQSRHQDIDMQTAISVLAGSIFKGDQVLNQLLISSGVTASAT